MYSTPSEHSTTWEVKTQGSARSAASSARSVAASHSSWQTTVLDTDDEEDYTRRRPTFRRGAYDPMEEATQRLASLRMGQSASRQAGGSSRSSSSGGNSHSTRSSSNTSATASHRSGTAFGAIGLPPPSYPAAASTASYAPSLGPIDDASVYTAEPHRPSSRQAPSARSHTTGISSTRTKRVCDVSEYLLGPGRGLSLSVQSDLVACRTFGQQAARRKALATKGDRLVKLIVVMRDELSKDLTKELQEDIEFQPDPALLETDALLGDWAHRQLGHLTIGAVTGDVARAFAACLKGLLFCVYRSEGLNELALAMMHIGLVPNPYPELI